MLHRRMAAFAAAVLLPVFAQAQAVKERPGPREHGPIRDLVDNGDGTAAASNWGGYAISGSSFTSAEGSWIMPTAKCSANALVGFWVGLDGYTSRTVEQTGIAAECRGSKPVYYAWYEFYPKKPFTIKMTVKPGDRMSASVVYKGGQFKVTMKNVTTGATFSKTAAVAGAARSSAEWIVEAPGEPITDFGTGLFGKDNTSVAGTNEAAAGSASKPIGDFSKVHKITLKRGAKEGVPSALSTDGTSFSVHYE